MNGLSTCPSRLQQGCRIADSGNAGWCVKQRLEGVEKMLAQAEATTGLA
jgi:hypothetical protein